MGRVYDGYKKLCLEENPDKPYLDISRSNAQLIYNLVAFEKNFESNGYTIEATKDFNQFDLYTMVNGSNILLQATQNIDAEISLCIKRISGKSRTEYPDPSFFEFLKLF